MGMQEQAGYYARRAHEYERIYDRNEPSRQREQRDIAYQLGNEFAGRNVLEVACGTGFWTKDIARTAARVVATDFNHEVLRVAQQTKAFPPTVNLVQADAFNLPFPPNTFDGGVANFWFSHLLKADRSIFLNHFHSRLKPGSRVFIADNVYNEGVGGELITPPGDENTYKLRKLSDGSETTIIKNYPTAEELEEIFDPFAEELFISHREHFWIASYTLQE